MLSAHKPTTIFQTQQPLDVKTLRDLAIVEATMVELNQSLLPVTQLHAGLASTLCTMIETMDNSEAHKC